MSEQLRQLIKAAMLEQERIEQQQAENSLQQDIQKESEIEKLADLAQQSDLRLQ